MIHPESTTICHLGARAIRSPLKLAPSEATRRALSSRVEHVFAEVECDTGCDLLADIPFERAC
jgi:hypothetical protein